MKKISARKRVCYHEAGHAIMHSLGGSHPTQIAVGTNKILQYMPEAAQKADGVAVCNHPNIIACDCLYADNYGNVVVDDEKYLAFNNMLSDEGKIQLARQTRALICGAVAGNIGDCVLTGDNSFRTDDEDFTIASGLADLLPGGTDELDFLIKDTHKALTILQPRLKRLSDYVSFRGHVDFRADNYAREWLPKPFSLPIWEKYKFNDINTWGWKIPDGVLSNYVDDNI